MPAHSASMLRIACDGNAAGAIVTVNGRKMGECPLDMQVQPGDVRIQATKPRDPETNLVFEQSLYLGDGVVKRIEVTLDKTVLTPEGLRLQSQRRLAAEAAERQRQREAELERRRQEDLKRQSEESALRERKRIQMAIDQELVALRAQGVEPGNGKSFRDCPDCPALVLISASGQTPVAFGQYEVSVQEYSRFVEETGWPVATGCTVWDGRKWFPPERRWTVDPQVSWRNPGFEQAPDHPVVCVSVKDALGFLEWLSKKTGYTYELPSQFWWVAASGSWAEIERRTDPWQGCRWGNVPDLSLRKLDLGVMPTGQRPCDDGIAFTAPVHSFEPSSAGVWGLLGNASELLNDTGKSAYGYFERWEDKNKQLPGEVERASRFKGRKVIGSSFFDYPSNVVLYEEENEFTAVAMRSRSIGFRVMRKLLKE